MRFIMHSGTTIPVQSSQGEPQNLYLISWMTCFSSLATSLFSSCFLFACKCKLRLSLTDQSVADGMYYCSSDLDVKLQ